ncbi:MAG: NUDIX domain-containing protein [Clostridia bacterium]|nr:NUDIX domain-containing protein [Clostridia bacterium]
MQHEKSCGALVLRRDGDGKDYVLMIRHRAGGHRSFPKGHMEQGETEWMTAIREVFEETGVQIRIRSDFRATVHYAPGPGVRKEVVYFLTRTEQKEIRPREGEIAEVEWVPLDAAERALTHENDKTVLRAAIQKLESARQEPEL